MAKKQKTKKSLTRRVKVTATGKILRGRNFKRHLRVKKSSKQKRRLKGNVEFHPTYAKKIRTYLGVNRKFKTKKHGKS